VSPQTKDEETDSLRRLPGTGWQTRDGRFTIETASGTWSLLDSEQTDDLGLPLVRGPFRSLTDAKAAIEAARTAGPATSKLPASAPPKTAEPKASPKQPARPRKPAKPEEPDEPRWLADLDAADRRRATRLMSSLDKLGVRDAEGVVRRDVAGDVPTVARIAIANDLAKLLGDGDPAGAKLVGRVLEVLTEGREESLDVRWRLVDDAGRPVGVSAADITAALKRAQARD
jgi:hypothetical protein